MEYAHPKALKKVDHHSHNAYNEHLSLYLRYERWASQEQRATVYTCDDIVGKKKRFRGFAIECATPVTHRFYIYIWKRSSHFSSSFCQFISFSGTCFVFSGDAILTASVNNWMAKLRSKLLFFFKWGNIWRVDFGHGPRRDRSRWITIKGLVNSKRETKLKVISMRSM